jgi:hypothetical protein
MGSKGNKGRIGLFLCISIALMLSGCWNKREPADLAIVDSSLYDINDDGTYKITVAVINPVGIGSPDMPASAKKNPFITFSAEGKSIREESATYPNTVRKQILARTIRRVIFGKVR